MENTEKEIENSEKVVNKELAELLSKVKFSKKDEEEEIAAQKKQRAFWDKEPVVQLKEEIQVQG